MITEAEKKSNLIAKLAPLPAWLEKLDGKVARIGPRGRVTWGHGQAWIKHFDPAYHYVGPFLVTVVHDEVAVHFPAQCRKVRGAL